MKNLLVLAVSILTVATLTACGGGGGGGTTSPGNTGGSGGGTTPPGNTGGNGGGPGNTIGGTTMTHAQMAQTYLDALNYEYLSPLGVCPSSGSCTGVVDQGIPLGYTMAKVNTQQAGYVVLQFGPNMYEAVYVDGWNPGIDPEMYQGTFTPNGMFATYPVVNALGNGNYQDPMTGIVFEVARPTPKDLQKIAAYTQALQINGFAKNAQKKFGLTLERATDVAKLAIEVRNTPHMTEDDYDGLSMQLLGVPVKKIDLAVDKSVKGDKTVNNDLNDIINQAAQTNGVGTEQARDLVNSLMK